VILGTTGCYSKEKTKFPDAGRVDWIQAGDDSASWSVCNCFSEEMGQGEGDY